MENYQTDGVYFPQADSLSFWVVPPQWGRKAPSSPQFWQGNEVKRPVRLVTPFNSSGWYRWAETHLAPTAYIPPNKYLQMANKPHALRKYIEGWQLWCYDPARKPYEKVSIPYVWPSRGSRPLGICREPFQDKKEDLRLKQVLREMRKDWQRCFCRGIAKQNIFSSWDLKKLAWRDKTRRSCWKTEFLSTFHSFSSVIPLLPNNSFWAHL